MKPAPILALLLRGLSQVLFIAGGFSFLIGGRLIATFTTMNRFSAEIVGIAICALFVLFGLLVRSLSGKLAYKSETLSVTGPD
jgi:hypothetical protein